MRNLAVEKSSRIKFIVLENKKFIIRQFEISFSLLSKVDSETDLDKLQLEQNISFAKAMTFVDAILHGSIIITPSMLPFYEKTFCEFDNNFVLLPDTTDPTLISVIQKKLTAIVGETCEVNSILLYDLDDHLKYSLDIFEQDEEDDDLPNIKDFLGEFHLTDIPWWNRADETTWDGAAKNQEEYDAIKNTIQETEETEATLFEDIEESIRAVYKNAENTGEIIEVDFTEEHKHKKKKWKPTVI